MRKNYDVIVVGGGPAGSRAAKHAAAGGARVLVLEKDREVGAPVRCAEGVGDVGLRYIARPGELKIRWIAQTITGLRFVAPDGNAVEIHHQLGYVLNRKQFDYDMAVEAADAGAEIITKACVTGLLFEDGFVTGVTANILGKEINLNSRIVIGADGVESRVGRWAKLRSHFDMHDLETCAQVTAANVDVKPDMAYFYFGTNLAPGGYAWIFPKGGGVANIGLGISGDYSGRTSPQNYLQRFLEKHFPNVSILTSVVGGVPCARALKKLSGNGVMLVGDAAHQSNPVSGGGLIRALVAAQIAGGVAAEAIRKNDVSRNVLQKYDKEWYRGEGRTHNLFYRLKEGIFKLTDEELNKTAVALNRLEPDKRNLVEMFKTALVSQPRLILDAIKVFL
ncbi:NAD(P)/FAD-dependent oxidoreductase [candidate division KSB1 bacterium]|nr:NAD(P)/FAD-dependent oxidoreductase [candidate division KSB1 bacterium]